MKEHKIDLPMLTPLICNTKAIEDFVDFNC